MFLITRMPPGAPRNKPTDARMTAAESEPGVVLSQDIRVLAGLQRGRLRLGGHRNPASLAVIRSVSSRASRNVARALQEVVVSAVPRRPFLDPGVGKQQDEYQTHQQRNPHGLRNRVVTNVKLPWWPNAK